MDLDLEIIFEENKTAKEMFEAIKEAYGNTLKTYIQLVIEKYNSYWMKENENVKEHVNKIIVITNELVVVGNLIPNKIQISIVLHSLPNSWYSIIIVIYFCQ